jgi:hypothetical protein
MGPAKWLSSTRISVAIVFKSRPSHTDERWIGGF